MRYRVAAAPARAWNALVDVARWPDWIESYESMTRLHDAPLGDGSKVRIKQRGMRVAVWQVAGFEVGRYFAWESTQPAVRTVRRHAVRSDTAGGH